MGEWSWGRVWRGLEWRAHHYQDSPKEGSLSASVGSLNEQVAVRLEYHLHHRSCGVHVWFRDEHAITVGVQVPLVASLWLSLDIPRANGLISRLLSGESHSIDLSVHDYALWWRLVAPMNSWTSGTPRWRDGVWHPLGRHMRQGDVEVLNTREVLVPMPERSYRATVKLTRSRWGFTHLPRLFDEVLTHADIEMHKGEQIPFPGKGENSWDCGDDATFSMHCPARSIEEGVGTLVGSVLRDRHCRGWAPAQAVANG